MNLTYRRVFPWQRLLCKISVVCHLWLLFKSFSKRWHLFYMQSFCFWRSIQSMIGSRSDKQKIIKPSLNLIPQRKWKEWKKNNFWNLQEEKWHREHINYCSGTTYVLQHETWLIAERWRKVIICWSYPPSLPPPPKKKWDRTNCNCKDNRLGKISKGRRKGSDLIWQIRKASTITSESC